MTGSLLAPVLKLEQEQEAGTGTSNRNRNIKQERHYIRTLRLGPLLREQEQKRSRILVVQFIGLLIAGNGTGTGSEFERHVEAGNPLRSGLPQSESYKVV